VAEGAKAIPRMVLTGMAVTKHKASVGEVRPGRRATIFSVSNSNLVVGVQRVDERHGKVKTCTILRGHDATRRRTNDDSFRCDSMIMLIGVSDVSGAHRANAHDGDTGNKRGNALVMSPPGHKILSDHK